MKKPDPIKTIGITLLGLFSVTASHYFPQVNKNYQEMKECEEKIDSIKTYFNKKDSLKRSYMMDKMPQKKYESAIDSLYNRYN
ncbi:MAG: hypothetical protein ACQEP1_04760 [Nanobdellota archaeon]